MEDNIKTTWTIDPNHSEVQFKVKHLMISNVSGTFNTFSGNVQNESNDFNNAEIHFEIDSNSVDTNLAERDSHLKSPLFLDVEKYPTITFHGFLHKKDSRYTLEGDLTLCAVKKPVTLDVDLNGTGEGRFGDTRAGFEANGKINRKDFGIHFSLLTEAGNMVVGEDINLHFDIQLLRTNA
jgi:polyisoprenoid-binding protein YceI